MALEVNIKKHMGSFNLAVDFSTKDEIYALLGPSGCGKSMTLRCIAGITKPDSGKIVLNGETFYDSEHKINISPQKRNIGFLFQHYALFPNMTVKENIAVGLPKGENEALINEMIERLYLNQQQHNLPRELSGGQQQRTALARLLISKPKLILLDEPFSALDSYLKWQMELELMAVLEEFEGSTIFVSHNRGEVYRICDRISVMESGSISCTDSKKGLFKNPKTLSAAILSGCKNFSHAKKIDDHAVYASDWGSYLHSDNQVPEEVKYVGVRAHYWVSSDKPSDFNTVNCRVEKILEDTFSIIVLLKALDNHENFKEEYSRLRLEIVKPEYTNELTVGSKVCLAVAKKNILLLV